MTLKDTRNATSSQALAAGPARSDWPDGTTLDLFGPAPAPASRSLPPGSKAALLTTGISGLSGLGSSASAALTLSLANRLRERLGSGGSIEYSQTWKKRTTPAGRLYWEHTASGRPTSGSGCGGWPTPDASVAQDGESFETWEARRLATKARVKNGNGFGTPLTIAAQMAGWPTPMAGSPGTDTYNPAGNTDSSRKTVALLSGWPTPTKGNADGSQMAKDASTTGRRPDGSKATVSLNQVAQTAGWATPTAPMAHDSDHSAFRWNPNKKQDDPVMQLLGREQNLSDVPMENRGQLNPAFSLWLQGYPSTWNECAPSKLLGWRK